MTYDDRFDLMPVPCIPYAELEGRSPPTLVQTLSVLLPNQTRMVT